MHPLSTQHERFAELLMIGKAPHLAYESVFGVKEGETLSSQTLKSRARALACDSQVVQRVRELRAPVIQQLQDTYVFTCETALRKADRAHDLAEVLGDPGNMLKAIELQAKLKKLLVTVSETRHDSLDAVATADLVLLLSELKARRACDVLVESVDVVAASGDWEDLL